MKTIGIILGNRLNDDGSITKLMKHRLELALELEKNFDLDKIIVSGGIANKKANVSEASVMASYLIEKGVSAEKIIIEDQSMSTVANAKYSLEIVRSLKAEAIIVCTSIEHMTRTIYNPVKIFSDAIGEDNIKLMIYTDNK